MWKETVSCLKTDGLLQQQMGSDCWGWPALQKWNWSEKLDSGCLSLTCPWESVCLRECCWKIDWALLCINALIVLLFAMLELLLVPFLKQECSFYTQCHSQGYRKTLPHWTTPNLHTHTNTHTLPPFIEIEEPFLKKVFKYSITYRYAWRLDGKYICNTLLLISVLYVNACSKCPSWPCSTDIVYDVYSCESEPDETPCFTEIVYDV